MKKKILLSALSFLLLSGCVGVHVSLLSETEPLEEKVLEGKGTPKLLLLDLSGVITFREEKEGLLVKRPSKVAFFREALHKAEGDGDVVGVIVRINSPGGSVAASDTIYHEIMNFKQRKKVPVYAYIMELGASGGYYVAAAADRIIASPSAIVGSIGVVAMKFNIEGLLSKIGVVDETYKSGPKKDFWSPFRPSTAEEKAMLQDIIDKLYARFVEVVYVNRQNSLSKQQVTALADGRILTAGDALEARLIDQTAYLDETIASMRKEVSVDQGRIITYDRPNTFKANIYSEYEDMTSTGQQVINLISIDAEALLLFPRVQFMYIWNP